MRIENLCKSYHNMKILENLSLELSDGGIYAVLGASGAGKTTFLHSLLGLIRPDDGRIEGISGKRFSAVFQEDRLCDFLTAAENVLIVHSEGRIGDAGNLSSINEQLAGLLPVNSLQQPVSDYSGGMRRRAAVARAVLADSDILVMDEPFSGLDEETKKKTAAFLLKNRRGRTLIFSAHSESEAELLGAEKIFFDMQKTG